MEPIAHEVSAFLLIPFVLMLLSIAIGPVVAGHWWEKNINKLVVALVLGIPTAIILIAQGFGHELQHQIVFDYIPFVLRYTRYAWRTHSLLRYWCYSCLPYGDNWRCHVAYSSCS